MVTFCCVSVSADLVFQEIYYGGFLRTIIYSFEPKTVGRHWEDWYAIRPTRVAAAAAAAAADARWTDEPAEQKVVMVYALAPSVSLPAICQF